MSIQVTGKGRPPRRNDGAHGADVRPWYRKERYQSVSKTTRINGRQWTHSRRLPFRRGAMQ